MFQNILFSILVLMSSFAFAQQASVVASPSSEPGVTTSAIEGTVRLKAGWVVTYVAQEFDAQKPTLVLLPGIYRGYEESESFIQDLKSRRINFVAVHFSSHLRSIKALGKDEVPVFTKGRNVTGASLALEVEAVVKDLKIQKPVLVSLSYSALVIPFLDAQKFPYVIETAPMGVYNETNTMGSFIGQWWADVIMATNPNGKEIVEKAKEQTFYNYWSSYVTGLSLKNQDYLNPLTAQRQVDGYVGLAYASVGFDLTQVNFKNGPYRAWIFGALEDFSRAQTQKKAVALYLGTLDSATAAKSIFGKPGVMTVPNAGHIVPVDAPKAYVDNLVKVLAEVESEGRF